MTRAPERETEAARAPSGGDDPVLTQRGLPRGALIRFAILAALLLIAAALLRWSPLRELLDRDRLTAILATLQQSAWAPSILIGLWVVLSPLGVPVSPLVFAGGAVFGVGWGWTYNLIGSMLGATFTFWIAHHLGRDLVSHLTGRAGLERAERLLARHGFWTVLRSRFLPLPFALINYGAALVGLRLPTFLLATFIGLVPSLLVYTYFSHTLVQVAAAERTGLVRNLLLAMGGLLALTLLPALLRRIAAWRRDD